MGRKASRVRPVVLTWLWTQPGGRTGYGAPHVNIWADMVRRNLTIDHELACVTDMPEGIDPRVRIIAPPNEFLDITLPTWKAARPQCLRRLTMFRRDAADIFGAERIVCMDLDLIVSGSLDPVLDIDEDFRIFRGTASGRIYNGSMMSIRAGSRPQVYETFTPAGAISAGKRYVGSDQAWISQCIPGEPTWGPEHGVHWWGDRLNRVTDGRMLFFPGTVKPWNLVAAGDRFARQHYRRSPAGAALVLGYGRAVWPEAEAALRARKFDAVIASPEASALWPGPVLAVADDDRHAERLAAMHGYDEMVFAGRSA